LRQSGVALHQLDGGSNSNPLLAARYIALLRRIAPTLVQTWLPQSDVFAGIATRVLGIPWILSERASADAYPATFKNKLRVSLGRRADAVVANSRTGAAYWSERVPASVPCLVISNAVPVDEIAATISDDIAPAVTRAGSRLILCVGRLAEQKNFRVVVLALRSILQSFDATLVICGAGPLRPSLEALVREHHLEDRVHLFGARPDVWRLMASADVLVSSSLFEGHPNVVLEAAACGCPIVASDIAEHREFLDDDAVIFADPAVPQSIADGVCKVFDDPEAARARAVRARHRVLHLSSASMADKYEHVYQRLIADEHPTRAPDSLGRAPLVRMTRAFLTMINMSSTISRSHGRAAVRRGMDFSQRPLTRSSGCRHGCRNRFRAQGLTCLSCLLILSRS
jgi:glycosyltransferase involved in cell wall biosynthesis